MKNRMKNWLMLLPLALLLSGAALAVDGIDCRRMAEDPKQLPGVKAGMKAVCAYARKSQACEKSADEKKLAGTAREQFLYRCEGIRETPKNRTQR
jgi:hypothetical protein